MELLCYVLGSCGAVHNFTTVHAGDIGYHWRASEEQAKEMQFYGTIKDSEVQRAVIEGTN
jgi:hypothetical protein